MRTFWAGLLAIALIAGNASAEVVFVKYRGPVDLRSFDCNDVSRSSLVRRVCFDRRERYMLINLQGVYYHYCGIDAGTVSALLSAGSIGSFYNSQIKGRFDCRANRTPANQ